MEKQDIKQSTKTKIKRVPTYEALPVDLEGPIPEAPGSLSGADTAGSRRTPAQELDVRLSNLRKDLNPQKVPAAQTATGGDAFAKLFAAAVVEEGEFSMREFAPDVSRPELDKKTDFTLALQRTADALDLSQYKDIATRFAQGGSIAPVEQEKIVSGYNQLAALKNKHLEYVQSVGRNITPETRPIDLKWKEIKESTTIPKLEDKIRLIKPWKVEEEKKRFDIFRAKASAGGMRDYEYFEAKHLAKKYPDVFTSLREKSDFQKDILGHNLEHVSRPEEEKKALLEQLLSHPQLSEMSREEKKAYVKTAQFKPETELAKLENKYIQQKVLQQEERLAEELGGMFKGDKMTRGRLMRTVEHTVIEKRAWYKSKGFDPFGKEANFAADITAEAIQSNVKTQKKTSDFLEFFRGRPVPRIGSKGGEHTEGEVKAVEDLFQKKYNLPELKEESFATRLKNLNKPEITQTKSGSPIKAKTFSEKINYLFKGSLPVGEEAAVKLPSKDKGITTGYVELYSDWKSAKPFGPPTAKEAGIKPEDLLTEKLATMQANPPTVAPETSNPFHETKQVERSTSISDIDVSHFGLGEEDIAEARSLAKTVVKDIPRDARYSLQRYAKQLEGEFQPTGAATPKYFGSDYEKIFEAMDVMGSKQARTDIRDYYSVLGSKTHGKSPEFAEAADYLAQKESLRYKVVEPMYTTTHKRVGEKGHNLQILASPEDIEKYAKFPTTMEPDLLPIERRAVAQAKAALAEEEGPLKAQRQLITNPELRLEAEEAAINRQDISKYRQQEPGKQLQNRLIREQAAVNMFAAEAQSVEFEELEDVVYTTPAIRKGQAKETVQSTDYNPELQRALVTEPSKGDKSYTRPTDISALSTDRRFEELIAVPDKEVRPTGFTRAIERTKPRISVAPEEFASQQFVKPRELLVDVPQERPIDVPRERPVDVGDLESDLMSHPKSKFSAKTPSQSIFSKFFGSGHKVPEVISSGPVPQKPSRKLPVAVSVDTGEVPTRYFPSAKDAAAYKKDPSAYIASKGDPAIPPPDQEFDPQIKTGPVSAKLRRDSMESTESFDSLEDLRSKPMPKLAPTTGYKVLTHEGEIDLNPGEFKTLMSTGELPANKYLKPRSYANPSYVELRKSNGEPQPQVGPKGDKGKDGFSNPLYAGYSADEVADIIEGRGIAKPPHPGPMKQAFNRLRGKLPYDEPRPGSRPPTGLEKFTGVKRVGGREMTPVERHMWDVNKREEALTNPKPSLLERIRGPKKTPAMLPTISELDWGAEDLPEIKGKLEMLDVELPAKKKSFGDVFQDRINKITGRNKPMSFANPAYSETRNPFSEDFAGDIEDFIGRYPQNLDPFASGASSRRESITSEPGEVVPLRGGSPTSSTSSDKRFVSGLRPSGSTESLPAAAQDKPGIASRIKGFFSGSTKSDPTKGPGPDVLYSRAYGFEPEASEWGSRRSSLSSIVSPSEEFIPSSRSSSVSSLDLPDPSQKPQKSGGGAGEQLPSKLQPASGYKVISHKEMADLTPDEWSGLLKTGELPPGKSMVPRSGSAAPQPASRRSSVSSLSPSIAEEIAKIDTATKQVSRRGSTSSLTPSLEDALAQIDAKYKDTSRRSSVSSTESDKRLNAPVEDMTEHMRNVQEHEAATKSVVRPGIVRMRGPDGEIKEVSRGRAAAMAAEKEWTYLPKDASLEPTLPFAEEPPAKPPRPTGYKVFTQGKTEAALSPEEWGGLLKTGEYPAGKEPTDKPKKGMSAFVESLFGKKSSTKPSTPVAGLKLDDDLRSQLQGLNTSSDVDIPSRRPSVSSLSWDDFNLTTPEQRLAKTTRPLPTAAELAQEEPPFKTTSFIKNKEPGGVANLDYKGPQPDLKLSEEMRGHRERVQPEAPYVEQKFPSAMEQARLKKGGIASPPQRPISPTGPAVLETRPATPTPQTGGGARVQLPVSLEDIEMQIMEEKKPGLMSRIKSIFTPTPKPQAGAYDALSRTSSEPRDLQSWLGGGTGFESGAGEDISLKSFGTGAGKPLLSGSQAGSFSSVPLSASDVSIDIPSGGEPKQTLFQRIAGAAKSLGPATGKGITSLAPGMGYGQISQTGSVDSLTSSVSGAGSGTGLLGGKFPSMPKFGLPSFKMPTMQWPSFGGRQGSYTLPQQPYVPMTNLAPSVGGSSISGGSIGSGMAETSFMGPRAAQTPATSRSSTPAPSIAPSVASSKASTASSVAPKPVMAPTSSTSSNVMTGLGLGLTAAGSIVSAVTGGISMGLMQESLALQKEIAGRPVAPPVEQKEGWNREWLRDEETGKINFII